MDLDYANKLSLVFSIFSYRLTDEANNPVYESLDKDLDIKSNEEKQALTDKANNLVYECADKNPNIKDNEEKQALHPSHVYHELEDPQKPTSCTHEYSIPYEASMSISDGPKITPALNDTDSLTHFNELYENSEMEIWMLKTANGLIAPYEMRMNRWT